jgi:transcriptional regulator with XRE-family HTH domain
MFQLTDKSYTLEEFVLAQMAQRDMSARQFAEFVGVSHSTVNRMLDSRNEIPPSMEVLIKISNATRVNLTTLIQLSYPDIALDEGLSPSAQLLAQQFEELPDNIKDVIMTLINSHSLRVKSNKGENDT